MKTKLETLIVVLVCVSVLTSTNILILLEGPHEWILAWVDEEAQLGSDGSRYLHEDPAMYQIRWIMITFDPDIEQNNLFWILAELRMQDVERISQTRWIKSVSLIKTGHYERVISNPKLATNGIELAIQRAAKTGKSLEIIAFLANGGDQTMVEELTVHINNLGGTVLKVSPYLSSLLVRLPAENILILAEHPYVKEIYSQGPVVFLG